MRWLFLAPSSRQTTARFAERFQLGPERGRIFIRPVGRLKSALMLLVDFKIPRGILLQQTSFFSIDVVDGFQSGRAFKHGHGHKHADAENDDKTAQG
jgi:hypothetical protein